MRRRGFSMGQFLGRSAQEVSWQELPHGKPPPSVFEGGESRRVCCERKRETVFESRSHRGVTPYTHPRHPKQNSVFR